jgi:hypothetical protein
LNTHAYKDYEEKMAVSLLKLELLWTESAIDAGQIYAGVFIGICGPLVG